MPTLEARVARTLAARRQSLLRRFGWAGPELGVAVEPRERRLVVRGETPSSRALAAALAELRALLPDGWTIDATAAEVMRPRAWFALPPGITRLWRSPLVGSGCLSGHVFGDMDGRTRDMCAGAGAAGLSGHVLEDIFGAAADARHERPVRADGAARGGGDVRMFDGTCFLEHVLEDMELCTELVPGDGPVGLIAAVAGAALVRASDGTLGWTRARLAAPRPAPPAATPACARGEAAVRLTAALRRFRGVPYLLGGTTPRGVDCSGLVQRAVRAALGVVLPRHSGDQLGLGGPPGRGLGEPGDLLFLWGAGESPCHVGVVLRGGRPGGRTLIHASSRRGRVIEEPLEHALARASRVRHMELEQLLAR